MFKNAVKRLVKHLHIPGSLPLDTYPIDHFIPLFPLAIERFNYRWRILKVAIQKNNCVTGRDLHPAQKGTLRTKIPRVGNADDMGILVTQLANHRFIICGTAIVNKNDFIIHAELCEDLRQALVHDGYRLLVPITCDDSRESFRFPWQDTETDLRVCKALPFCGEPKPVFEAVPVGPAQLFMSQPRIAKPIREIPPAIRHRPELWLFRYTEEGTYQQRDFAKRCLATCGDIKYLSGRRAASGERGAHKSPRAIINVNKIARDTRID